MKTFLALPFILLTSVIAPIVSMPSNEIALEQGDVLHFGIAEEESRFDARFVILDANYTNTGEEGMFLWAESLVSNEGKAIPFRQKKDEDSNSYTGSYAKQWCTDFYEKSFTELEKSFILPSFCSDEAFSIPASFGFGNNTPMVDFAAEENILNGDCVFLLSAKEASNASYGLDSASNRLSSYNGVTASYWLRSPHDRSNFPNDVGIVFYNGWLMDFIQDSDNVFGVSPIYMRPALNIKKLSGNQLIKVRDHEYCLKEESEMFENPPEKQEFRENNPLPLTIALLAAGLVLIIGIPILIVILVKRHKKKKAKQA